jgi:hypothetical protein
MTDMSGSARTSRSEASSASLARWGGAAGCLGGVSYGASGYLDNPDAPRFVVGVVLPVLEVTTSILFLGGMVGLYSWRWREGRPLRRIGLLVGLVGSLLGLFEGLDWRALDWWALDWWVLDWWMPLFGALTLMGVAMIVEDASRLVGVLVLVSGTLGWVSLLTDPAFYRALVPVQPVHVVFAVLFCLSCMAWGAALFARPHRVHNFSERR